MDYLRKILIEFELHSPEGIVNCFKNGVDPNGTIDGKPLFFELVNMYSRGPGFRECVSAFVENGLDTKDDLLIAILLNDAVALKKIITRDPNLLHKRYSFNCTFTPLFEASLLHICAEYNHLDAALVLLEAGLDVNVKAGIDKNGFGGHTPIFHTVNQHDNKCIDCLKLFLEKKADIHLTVKGLIWGEGYEWETFIPAVNPISYSMMGLLRQFQRNEFQIYEVVALLMNAAYGINYQAPNIPNKYLLPANT